MPLIPRKLTRNQGPYASDWAKMVNVANSLKPRYAPGVLTAHTVHGVFRKFQKPVMPALPTPSPDSPTQFKPSVNGNVYKIIVRGVSTGAGLVEDVFICGNFSWYGTETVGGVSSQYSRKGFARLNAGLGLTPSAWWFQPDDPTMLLGVQVTGACMVEHTTPGTFDSIFTCGLFNNVNDGGIDPGGGGVGTGGTQTRAAMLDLQNGQLYVDFFDAGTGMTTFGSQDSRSGCFSLLVDPLISGAGTKSLIMLYGISGWNGNDVIGMGLFSTDGTWIDTNGGAGTHYGWTSPNSGDPGPTGLPMCPVVMVPPNGGYYYVPTDTQASWKGVGSAGASNNVVFLIKKNGDLDTAFDANVGTAADDTITHVAVQSSGKAIVIGKFTLWNGTSVGRIVRLNTDGTLDSTFNSGGSGFTAPNPLWCEVQDDDKIIVAGSFTGYNGSYPNYGNLVRLNSNGTLDSTFNANFVIPSGLSVTNCAVKANGDVIATGFNITMTVNDGFGGFKNRSGIALFRSDGFCYGPP